VFFFLFSLRRSPNRTAVSRRAAPFSKNCAAMSHKNLRLMKELKSFAESASPGIRAAAEETNILRWHYVIEGPPDSPCVRHLSHSPSLICLRVSLWVPAVL
jgi:hypothetical protein